MSELIEIANVVLIVGFVVHIFFGGHVVVDGSYWECLEWEEQVDSMNCDCMKYGNVTSASGNYTTCLEPVCDLKMVCLMEYKVRSPR